MFLLTIRLNTVYASDSIQQERLPVSLEISRIRFHHAEITYFEINRVYAYLHQTDSAGDYKQRNSLLIKVQV